MAVEYTPAKPVVVELSAQDLRSRLYEALDVYVTAMGYPRGTEHHRAPMWTEHVTRPGWRAVGALLPTTSTAASGEIGTAASGEIATASQLVAIAYGYRGAPQQWWQTQVHAGMRKAGWGEADIRTMLANYFEVTEVHVHPDAQGHRLGETMLAKLLDGRSEERALLSTPEVSGENNRAWRLYRRLGFTDVVRNFTFAGDSRPFAVLGRRLPL
ncbi:GNAT family N-acetyltransferase [Aldersonia sp. NBC_00410]|uniref:GNAT family N-acetyltransferase n=1 Tax=Aldersonia sp. NBC_00410 TaxID=2975954 RepID=UPI0022597C23|nr:GNAT family N-acetyltransferase [Aldersonia sp. NBC_00410]MCX5045973.1 GNAT family N-acetyltransferase [Aldersonia sp. NBC_00410]